MKADLSLKLLTVGVVLAAIFLGFAGSKFVLITGFGTTATGTAWMNVSGTLSITLSDSLINFTNGSHTGAASYATLETNGSTVSGGTWATINDNITLQNDGNVLANVTLNSSGAAAWVGGSAIYQLYSFAWTNGTYNLSCLLPYNSTSDGTNWPANSLYRHEGNWHNITTANATYGVCQKLNYTDGGDKINLWLKVQVPIDTTVGAKSDSLRFEASLSN
jgi:hypothetical protein